MVDVLGYSLWQIITLYSFVTFLAPVISLIFVVELASELY